MSPTARSLNYLKSLNMLPAVVESYNSFTQRRKDAFGFLDIIAISDSGTMGVQTTTLSNMSARLNKIKGECREAAAMWLRAGNWLTIHGWYKEPLKEGSKAVRWKVKVVELDIRDLC